MEIEPQTIHNNKWYSLYIYKQDSRRFYKNHDTENRTSIFSLDDDSRNSSPTHKSEEIFNIDMVSDCILNYTIHCIEHSFEIQCDKSYKWN